MNAKRIHPTQVIKPAGSDRVHTEPISAILERARLLRCPEVLARVGMGRTALYEQIKLGRFPQPVKVGSSSHWVDAEVTQWIAGLMQARGSAPQVSQRD
jgi:prophage regulatory protein